MLPLLAATILGTAAMRPELHFPAGSPLEKTVSVAHEMALDNLLNLNTITDRTQDHNRSGLFKDPPGTFLRAGGDYQTPWTRDASINSWNAASLLSPEVAANTLWAVVEKRDGKLIVQQDNQWWDQLIWVTAIWNHYLVTGDRSVLAPAYEAATETLAERKKHQFNAKVGLYQGPSFFNDGIAGYPPPLGDTGSGSSFVLDHPGTDKIMPLSTNCVTYAAYLNAAKIGKVLGRPAEEIADLEKSADALKKAINLRLWDKANGKYGYYLTPEGKLEQYQEGMGISFAILFGVADAKRAKQIVSHVHREPKGIPSIWPSFSTFTAEHPGRHNNIIWPLVNGFYSHAAAVAGDLNQAGSEIEGLASLALASNDFKEIYHATTGEVDGGWQVGSHWPSCVRQTWSATSYLRAIYQGVFGLVFQENGLKLNPHVPPGWSGAKLQNLPYRGGKLDITLNGEGMKVRKVLLDGKAMKSTILASDLTGVHKLEITVSN